MNQSTQKTLADLLEESFEKYSNNQAFSCLGQTLTFKDIEEKSRALAVWLQEDSGLEAGDIDCRRNLPLFKYSEMTWKAH